MLTINADDHDMMCRMHRPDPKRPAHMQDKRMVVILPAAQYDEWLDSPPERSMEFMQQCPAERLLAVPEAVAGRATVAATHMHYLCAPFPTVP